MENFSASLIASFSSLLLFTPFDIIRTNLNLADKRANLKNMI